MNRRCICRAECFYVETVIDPFTALWWIALLYFLWYFAFPVLDFAHKCAQLAERQRNHVALRILIDIAVPFFFPVSYNDTVQIASLSQQNFILHKDSVIFVVAEIIWKIYWRFVSNVSSQQEEILFTKALTYMSTVQLINHMLSDGSYILVCNPSCGQLIRSNSALPKDMDNMLRHYQQIICFNLALVAIW